MLVFKLIGSLDIFILSRMIGRFIYSGFDFITLRREKETSMPASLLETCRVVDNIFHPVHNDVHILP